MIVNPSIVLLVLACAVHVSLGFEINVGEPCSSPGSTFVNTENCRSYILCSSGRFQLVYCPSGFYNPAKYDCDLDYKCVLDNVPEEVTTQSGVGTPSTILSTLISYTTTTDSITTDWSPSTTTDDVTTNPTTTEATEETKTITTTTKAITSTTERTSSEPSFPSTPSVGERNECPLVDSDEPTYLDDKLSCEK